MGRKQLDITGIVGQKFNKLTITEHLGLINNIRMVKAICDCGVEKEYRLFNIIGNGKTKSCGCYNKEVTIERNKKFITHGLTGHSLLSVWNGMISRCYDTTDVCFKNYGAKDVIICEEWRNDPKNTWGWETKRMLETPNLKDQLIEFNNESKCLRDWCKLLGFKYATIHRRIKSLGWTYEKAFTTPLVPTNQSGVHKKYLNQ